MRSRPPNLERTPGDRSPAWESTLGVRGLPGRKAAATRSRVGCIALHLLRCRSEMVYSCRKLKSSSLRCVPASGHRPSRSQDRTSVHGLRTFDRLAGRTNAGAWSYLRSAASLRASHRAISQANMADQPIPAPKETDPGPCWYFPCKSASSWGPRRGHDGDRGPLLPRPFAASGRRNGGRGSCPSSGSTSGVCKKKRQTSPLRPPKGTDPRTLPLFPCKPAVFRGPPEEGTIAIVDPVKPTP
jgi:hypothetical protein